MPIDLERNETRKIANAIEALERAAPAIGDAFGDDDAYTLLARAALGMLCDVYGSHTTEADREAHKAFWIVIRDALEGAWTHVNRSIEIAEGDHDAPGDLEAMRATLASIEAAQDKAHKFANLLSECKTAITEEWDIEHEDTTMLIDKIDAILTSRAKDNC